MTAVYHYVHALTLPAEGLSSLVARSNWSGELLRKIPSHLLLSLFEDSSRLMGRLDRSGFDEVSTPHGPPQRHQDFQTRSSPWLVWIICWDPLRSAAFQTIDLHLCPRIRTDGGAWFGPS